MEITSLPQNVVLLAGAIWVLTAIIKRIPQVTLDSPMIALCVGVILFVPALLLGYLPKDVSSLLYLLIALFGAGQTQDKIAIPLKDSVK